MAENKKRAYFHRIMGINIITYVICWTVSFISHYTTSVFLFGLYLLVIYSVLIAGTLFRRWIEKKYRHVELNFVRYIGFEIFSFIFFTLLSLFMFLWSVTSHMDMIVFLVFFNLLIFVAILLSVFDTPARILMKKARKMNDKEFETIVRKLARNMEINDVEIGILPWKDLKIANAIQTGTGKTYVFITDYLFENLTWEENLAVIAHEFAHIRLNHLLKTQIAVFSILLSIPYFYLLPPVIIRNASLASLIQVSGIWSGIILLFYFLTIVRRKYEIQADIEASKYVPIKYLISALSKLSDLNFIPRNISRAWGLDHPSISRRIERLKSEQK